MEIDIEELTRLYRSHYLSLASTLGAEGENAFSNLLSKIRNIYTYLDPGSNKSQIIIIKSLNDSYRPLESQPICIRNYSQLTQEECPKMVIQCLDNNDLLLWKNEQCNIDVASDNCIVYRFENDSEYFHVKQKNVLVNKVFLSFSSQFCLPSFDNLEEALEHYKAKFVRRGSCYLLKQVLFMPKRIFFINAPESVIRNSLLNFLRASLRGWDDIEAMPEQNVNERNPVDIKITWNSRKHVSLIEIKWLGKSYNPGNTTKYTATYDEQRANAGAGQLMNYINEYKNFDATKKCMGYHVVLDARRRTNTFVDNITRDDGLYYCDREITYDPAYHVSSKDVFAEPFRMFIEPVYNP